VPQRRRRFVLIAGEGERIPFSRPVKHRKTVREGFRKLRGRSAADPLQKSQEDRSEKVTRLIGRIPKNGGSRVALGAKSQLKCHRRVDGFHDIYGRMAWDKVAPTITGGFVNPSKGRFLHPTKDRTITLREGALLQGFPVRYTFSTRRGKFPAAEMIGNALPPPFARRHGCAVYRYLQGHHSGAASKEMESRAKKRRVSNG
jgi:DNA (cytosine-5)-methyltransferase 1